MNGMLQMLMHQAMGGNMQNNPLMQTFNQMMAGKTPQQQIETLLNCAKSKGININEKMFTEADLKGLGLR